MAEEITNKQIYDIVIDLRNHVRQLNGCVQLNTKDIAVLKSKGEEHSVNWDRVIQLGLAILQAIILWRLMTPAP